MNFDNDIVRGTKRKRKQLFNKINWKIREIKIQRIFYMRKS